jgi:hypothetical protein
MKIESNLDAFKGYTLIEVDSGDLSGYREPNVVVDIVMETENITRLLTNLDSL